MTKGFTCGCDTTEFSSGAQVGCAGSFVMDVGAGVGWKQNDVFGSRPFFVFTVPLARVNECAGCDSGAA